MPFVFWGNLMYLDDFMEWIVFHLV